MANWVSSCVLVALLVACAPTSQPVAYTAIADVMQPRGGPSTVCLGSWIQSPSEMTGGCWGVPIAGLDAASVPGAHKFSGGQVETGFVQLVGTWDRHVLRLAQAPIPMPASAATAAPVCDVAVARAVHGASYNAMSEAMYRLGSDDVSLRSRGIIIPGYGPCPLTLVLFIEVAFADPDTVSYLTTHYAPAQVGGWFRPVV